MKIKIERSGGFAGIATSKEMIVSKLPSGVADTVKGIMQDTGRTLTKNSTPKGAADHFNYKITIEDRNKTRVIDCNQYDIDNKLQLLISYVEKNSK